MICWIVLGLTQSERGYEVDSINASVKDAKKALPKAWSKLKGQLSDDFMSLPDLIVKCCIETCHDPSEIYALQFAHTRLSCQSQPGEFGVWPGCTRLVGTSKKSHFYPG